MLTALDKLTGLAVKFMAVDDRIAILGSGNHGARTD
jgi:phosphatidylserine/phosphatidylglycerophosphate/cardiolipin synthase-like enzyme